ncbi:MAG: bifunctional phosphoserine phosphatase/homoserine phosphotransferase ThrH [Kiritimatiellae bacterium]|nr:bifunctional phosphoserine phosphatase/homoserine phosphotransferase ThrH [Kiritimatiellia bacterium]
MTIVCLDMEGVLTPENWIAFADKVGIPDFKRTTRDEPDFDKLMHFRIDLMRKYGFTLDKLIEVINTIEPFDGAKEFIARLREVCQVVVVSDTFDIFGRPLMRKLGWPTLFHNDVVVDSDGYMCGYKLRSAHTKLDTVRGLQSCGGVETIAAGDSYNDLEMIRASKAGFLFRAPEKIKTENPDVPALEKYDELYDAIMEAMQK